jgi:putative mRNA 3-end processing factor
MLLKLTNSGLYCEAGDFFIDPWQPVQRAVITHAHGDHARRGSDSYLTVHDGERVLKTRMGEYANIQAVAYGEAVMINGVRVSLHPAGHILGSAQVRVEHQGEVAVVSGDYKTDMDGTCATFEPVRCNTFVSESTFGLPIYRWQPQAEIFKKINDWWRTNQAEGKCSILYGYALGKAQRLLAGVDPSIGPIYTHGAVERLNQAYRATGVALPPTTYVADAPTPRGKADWKGALVIAPPSAHGTPWMRKFGAVSTGFASGWMQIRGKRRQKAVDRGFVLSDHADWTGLLEAIKATGAEHIWVTHGYTAVMVRWLKEQGYDAWIAETRFTGEEEAGDADIAEEAGEAGTVEEVNIEQPETDA